MYGIEEVKKGISQPYLLVRELNRLFYNQFGRLDHNPDGRDLFNEDWDNLIILDACRYDIFANIADLPGKLEYRLSKAGATKEFIQSNFVGEKHYDTVYVTGNSWMLKLQAESSVHAVYDVVEHPEDGNKPTRITECAKKVADKHPNKRLIVHYIRPHHPFIGPLASDYFSGIDDQPPDLYNQIQSGEANISDETLLNLYIDNLEFILPKVEELLGYLEGKTVITADHGELLGERVGLIPIKTYGHIPGFYAEELVKVPWHIYENGERPDIVEDEPIGVDRSYAAGTKTIDERLRSLGYKMQNQ